MTWWLVTDFDRHTSLDTVDAVWVEGADADAAARAALPHFEEAREYYSGGDPEPVSHVFVVPVPERIAYEVIAVPQRAELQCCGGIGAGRHSALCPTAPDELKGWAGVASEPEA